MLNVKCHTTEDSGLFGNKDELTVMWGASFGGKIVKGSWRLKAIDDGDVKNFPLEHTTLFDGTLPVNSAFHVVVDLWDRDHGEGAEDYRSAFNDTIDATAAVGGEVGGIVASLAGAAKAIGLADIAAKIAKGVDPDDDLGQGVLEKSSSTLSSGKNVHELRIKGSGADYSVRIQTEAA